MTRCMIRRSTDASLTVRPGDKTLVESLMNRVAPSLPAVHSAANVKASLRREDKLEEWEFIDDTDSPVLSS